MKNNSRYNNTIQSRRQWLKRFAGGSAALLNPPLLAMPASNRSPPVVQTQYGRIEGRSSNDIAVFLGVPYGASTAKLRFQPAQVPDSWNGIRPAVEYAPACPQTRAQEAVSEDCLYLNLWTSSAAVRQQKPRKRPVLFWLHGGEYSHGSGSSPLFDGTHLCERDEVVVVTINHRLNAFGHLYLGRKGDRRFVTSGNVGITDIILALQWVRDNIHQFGGDPDNVTVFGQSGGGAKIATMMAMPAAAGLFHKAFTMSGQQVTAAGERAAAERADAFVRAAGLKASDWKDLLRMPVEDLVAAVAAPDPSLAGRSIYFGPVLDNQVLPRHPFYPDAPPLSQSIPMVIGNTVEETRAFLGKAPKVHQLTWKTLPAALDSQMYVDINTAKVIATYRELYPTYSPSEVFFAASTAGRSWRGAVIEAEARAKQGAPAYVYQLNWGSPLQSGRLGALHGLDVGLVFDNVQMPQSRTGGGAEAQRMADLMSESLLAFARTGNPSHRGLPAWKPYRLTSRETLIFDVKPRLEEDPRGAERKLFASVPFVQRGTF